MAQFIEECLLTMVQPLSGRLQMSDWKTPPEPFLCVCPDCNESVEPKTVEMEVNTPNYTGPFVVVAYRDLENNRKVVINGYLFSWNNIELARLYAEHLLTSRYAPLIMEDVANTLAETHI